MGTFFQYEKPNYFYDPTKPMMEYYLFHKKIELIVKNGYNPFRASNNGKYIMENFFIINENWIKLWKNNSCYYIAKDLLDEINVGEVYYLNLIKSHLYNLINQGIINNIRINYYASHSDYYTRFVSTNIYKLETFDWLIDEKTYKLLGLKNAPKIKGIISDSMITLLFKEYFLMKFIYYGKLEGKNELIQLTANFMITKDSNCDLYSSEYNFERFSKILQSNDSYKIMQLFNSFNIEYEKEVKIQLKDGLSFDLKNENLFLKYNKENSIKYNKDIDFNKVNSLRLIGLANVGATCYMNATLQCFINVNNLTKYLMNKTIYNKIINNVEICELANAYCKLLVKVCCDENVINYYEPIQFKDLISWKNPLFRGVNANDSKDLINFMLEEMNHELSSLINLNKTDINKNKKNFNQIIETNSYLMLKNFKEEFTKNNNSIISKTFFFIIETKSQCQQCNIIKYNYQTLFLLDFPLKEVYEYYSSNNKNPINNNGQKYISLNQCFEFYKKPSFFTGENSFYCSQCKGQRNATYFNNIYSLPPTLIIILNRGKGKAFDCYVDFPETLFLQQYILCQQSSSKYQLRSVISHLGESGMGGHFIAFCKNRINNLWYNYNDSIVTRCNDQKNGFKIGTPYILFYESGNNRNILFDENSNNVSNNTDIIKNNFINNNINIGLNTLNPLTGFPNVNQMNNNINSNINMNPFKRNNSLNNNNMNNNLLNMNGMGFNINNFNQNNINMNNMINNNMMNMNSNINNYKN